MRTREEQASVLMQVICDAGWKSSDAYDLAMREILEAERRAEQRVRAEIAGDSERLDWLCRNVSGAESRRMVGVIADTGNLDLWRKAIDTAREVE